MAESNRKLSAPLQKFATDLKAVLLKTETQIREMRAREASTKERKLEKHELCPLCGGPDVNGKCKCVESLQKNAIQGYDSGNGTAGSGLPSNTGMGATGGGGTQPMGLSEKGMCKSCGMAHDGDGYDHEFKKATMDGDMAGGALGKSGTTPHLDEVKPGLKKNVLPTGHSSSAAAQQSKPAPTTPVGHVNTELGGFKSIAGGSPVATGHLMPSSKINIGTAGRRAGNVQAPVSGMIPNAKGEKNYGSARSPYGTGAPGHASQKNMPSALKENMAPTAKAELPASKAVPEAAVKGAKAPKKGKDTTPAKQGSGGEIKGGKSLRKDAAAMTKPGKAPAGAGVPGKQPVGMGGGDAHKVAAAPKPAMGKLQAAGAAEVGRLKGAANVKQLKGDLANIKAQRAKPAHPAVANSLADVKALAPGGAPESVDVDVSDLDAGPAAKPGPFAQRAGAAAPAKDAGMKQMVHPNTAAARAKVGADPITGVAPDALQQVRNNMNAPRGGVNFLRGLFSMFHSPKAAPVSEAPPLAVQAPQQQGLTTSKRFHGALPLRREEASMQKGLKVPPSKADEIRKAALAMTKKDLEADSLDKMDPGAPLEGLSSANHNRTMLSVNPKRRRGKKNR